MIDITSRAKVRTRRQNHRQTMRNRKKFASPLGGDKRASFITSEDNELAHQLAKQ